MNIIEELLSFHASYKSTSIIPKEFTDRHYDPSEIEPIFSSALEFANFQSNFRIVSFGAEDGYWIKEIVSKFKDKLNPNITLIGVEGGSKVNAPSTFITDNQIIFSKLNLKGLDEETTFEEVLEKKIHPVITLDNEYPTIAHFYDGGVVRKEIIEQLIHILNFFKSGSIMIFVTSRIRNIDKDDVLADIKFIHKSMKKFGWEYINITFEDQKKKKWYICENNSLERTMQVLIYRKTQNESLKRTYDEASSSSNPT